MKAIAGMVECHAVDGQHCVAVLKQLSASSEAQDIDLARKFAEQCQFCFFFIQEGEKISEHRPT